jgi:hypothetical protein
MTDVNRTERALAELQRIGERADKLSARLDRAMDRLQAARDARIKLQADYRAKYGRSYP